MSSVIRYDLINYFLKEPVEIICSSAFPMVKRLILCPRPRNVEEPWPLQEAEPVSALLKIDGEESEEKELQEKSEEFMNWVCWLLSLQELHDVYYWGAHHYARQNSAWQIRSSMWKPVFIRQWKPPGQGIFEGTVLYWRLPQFLSNGLGLFFDVNFRRTEFTLALQLFLDSLPTDQLTEIRFVKKWSAFESLVNDQAERDGYLYTFGHAGTEEYARLKAEVKRVIDSDPSVQARPNANEALTKQLSALERMPVKMMAKRFLDELSINYDEPDINKIVNTRNDILHYIRTSAGLEEVLRLDLILKETLSEVLCRKLGWNIERELQVDYSTPYTEPLPDYLRLSNERHEVEASGSGRLESADGTHTFECEGSLSWNQHRIDGQFVSRDPNRLEILNLMNAGGSVKLSLEPSDSRILVEKAMFTHFGFGAHATVRGGPPQNFEVDFKLTALKLFRAASL